MCGDVECSTCSKVRGRGVEVEIEVKWGALIDRSGWYRSRVQEVLVTFPSCAESNLLHSMESTTRISSSCQLQGLIPDLSVLHRIMLNGFEAHMDRLELFAGPRSRGLEAPCCTRTKAEVSTFLQHKRQR